MKHILQLLVICLLFSCSSNDDSTDTPDGPIQMVSELNQWFQRGSDHWFNGANGTLEVTEKYRWIYFQGDTLINGMDYKKMYSRDVDSLFHIPNNGTEQFISKTDNLRYIAALRQDTNMVHYIYRNNDTEEVYANYAISLGDELNYKWNYDNATVTEIEEIPIGNTSINKYKLSNNQYFYQAIGGSYGLFKDWSVGIEGGIYLSCFTHQGSTITIDDGFYTVIEDCPAYSNL
jgi:hypothetical protein